MAFEIKSKTPSNLTDNETSWDIAVISCFLIILFISYNVQGFRK